MPPPPPARPRPTGWIAATGVLGVVVLVLVIALVTLASAGQRVGESAEASAQGACDLIDQIPEDGFDLTEDAGEADLDRLGAAQILAALASSQDGGFDDLAKAIEKPRVVAAETFDTTGDDVVDALADARTACDDEGL